MRRSSAERGGAGRRSQAVSHDRRCSVSGAIAFRKAPWCRDSGGRGRLCPSCPVSPWRDPVRRGGAWAGQVHPTRARGGVTAAWACSVTSAQSGRKSWSGREIPARLQGALLQKQAAPRKREIPGRGAGSGCPGDCGRGLTRKSI